MSKSYDEDINSNRFFQETLKHCCDLREISLILVPQSSSIPAKFDLEDIKTHIIVQDESTEQFVTQNGEKVVINHSEVKFGELEVPILFSETHYGQDWEKVKILCIKRPLTEISFEFESDCTQDEPFLDVQNALKVLEKNVDKNYICKRLDQAASEIIHSENGKNCKIVKEILRHLLSKTSKKINEKVLEICFFHLIYQDLFAWICAQNQDQDSKLNQKILTNFSDSKSNSSFNFLLKLTHPKAKLEALNQIFSHSEKASSSDELLPWLIDKLANCQIYNLYSQLDFMNNYSNGLTQQDLFNLATFEAALEHLKNSTCDTNDLIRTKNQELNNLFQAIIQDNLDNVKRFSSNSPDKCHPLCDCEKCDKGDLLTSKDDLKFWTPLSLASYLGKPLIIEHFTRHSLHSKCIEEKDKHGRTPLHLAAFKGHQNGVLLLLNAQAQINAKDNLNNTPLHYSAGFGHQSCTKALLYSAEQQTNSQLQVSASNLKGETPLHLASRHGFSKIVKLLLEYGADVNVKNSNGDRPVDVAHNIVIKRLLL